MRHAVPVGIGPVRPLCLASGSFGLITIVCALNTNTGGVAVLAPRHPERAARALLQRPGSLLVQSLHRSLVD